MPLQRQTSRRCQQKFIDAVAYKGWSQKSSLETFVVMRFLRLRWVFNRRNSGKTLWSPEKPANYAEVYQPLVFPACSPRKINHRQRLLTKTLEGGKSDLPSSFGRVLSKTIESYERSLQVQSSRNATTLAGAALAPTSFIGKNATLNPEDGTLSKLTNC